MVTLFLYLFLISTQLPASIREVTIQDHYGILQGQKQEDGFWQFNRSGKEFMWAKYESSHFKVRGPNGETPLMDARLLFKEVATPSSGKLSRVDFVDPKLAGPILIQHDSHRITLTDSQKKLFKEPVLIQWK